VTQSSGNYQTLFGLTLTPNVIGVLLGVAGLGGAGYLWSLLLPPLQEQTTQLTQEVSTLEAQAQQQQSRIQAQAAALQARAQAQARLQAIQQLFAQPQVMDTLLLDVNGRVKLAPGLKLLRYEAKGSAIVTDGSLGSAANGRLRRSTVELDLQGSYADTKQFLQGLEQLQPLLLVSSVKLVGDSSKDKAPIGAVPLQLSLTLGAISPLTEADRQTAAAAAKGQATEQPTGTSPPGQPDAKAP
jgi:type IV pilus assembly protein PilO